MIERYVDLDNGLNICAAEYLTGRKRPGLIVKNLTDYPLTDEDLERLGAARFEEPATEGYRRTGKAVLVGQTYYREYVDQTPEEAKLQREAALAETDEKIPRGLEDLINTLVSLGVMTEANLPQATQNNLIDKRAKREAL